MIGISVKQCVAMAAALVLTCACLFCASRALRRNSSEFKYRPFFEDDTGYDVLFFGTSHVINGIFPMQLWRDYGITSYNFGGHANAIYTSFHVCKNAVRYHKPLVAVLDIHAFTTGLGKKEYIHISFDAFPLTVQKVKSIRDVLGARQDRMEFLVPFTTYHNRWKEVSYGESWDSLCWPPARTVEKGAESRIALAAPAEFSHTDDVLPWDIAGLEYIRRFVLFCREQGIVPVLTELPFPAHESYQQEANSVELLAQELSVPYYNFLRISVVDYDTDCYDPSSHLNPSGARKVTEYLGAVLRADFGVLDHRAEPTYSSWNKDYEAYCRFCDSNMEASANLKICLMLLNNEVFSAELSVAREGMLDAVEQKLVAQVGDRLQRGHDLPEAACFHLSVHDSVTEKDMDLFFDERGNKMAPLSD